MIQKLAILLSFFFAGFISIPCFADDYDDCKTPLYRAAEKGDAEQMKRIIEGGADVNQRNPSCKNKYSFADETPLFAAVKSKKIEAVKLLTEKGADVAMKSVDGRSILHEAVYSTPEIISYLTSHGADPNAMYRGKYAKEQSDGTPLHIAIGSTLYYSHRSQIIYHGYYMIIEALLASGARIDEPNPRNGDTVLHMAAGMGDLVLVKYLVEHGADLNTKNLKGTTPYCESLWAENVEIQKYLRSSGAVTGGNPCVNEWRKEKIETYAENTGIFFKYMTIPLAYGGLSTWMFEKKYRDNPGNNRMGSFNSNVAAVCVGTVVGGLLGFFIYPESSGFLGGLAKLQGLVIGVLVGVPTAVILAHKYNWESRFKRNRGLYYSVPAASMGITLIAFTQSF